MSSPPTALAGPPPTHVARGGAAPPDLLDELTAPIPSPRPSGRRTFATTLAAHLGVAVAPLSEDTAPRPFVPMYRGAKPTGVRDRVALEGGGELRLFRDLRLGAGSAGKVVLGIFDAPGGPLPGREVVAVKKSRLDHVRRRLVARFPDLPRPPSSAQVACVVGEEAHLEAVLARHAGSEVAPTRLVMTAKQIYLTLPPMTGSLESLAGLLAPPHIPAWAPGALALGDLWPQILRCRARGVVHRDICWGNVLMRDGRFVLTDFEAACWDADPTAHLWHGTAWAQAPDRLVASGDGLDGVDMWACEAFSLGLITLTLSAGTAGQVLHDALAVGCALPDWRRAYAAAYPAWFFGSPTPDAGREARQVTSYFSAALARLPARLAASLRALLHPWPPFRSAALVTNAPPALPRYMRALITDHMERLGVQRAAHIARGVGCVADRGGLAP